MLVFDDDVEVRCGAFVGHRNAGDPRRRQRALREGHPVFRVFDDVDLLAPEFPDDRLHARSLHPDAGADRVHVALPAQDGDLGPFAGGTHRGLDHDGAVVDLGHFHLEQFDQQTGVGPGHHDLRSLGLLVDLDDHSADALTLAVAFVTGLLVAGNDRLGAAEIDDDVAALETSDRAVDDLADAILEFAEDFLPLGFPDTLVKDLLRGLGSDPPEPIGGDGDLDLLADLGVLLVLARLFECPLGGGILHLVDHLAVEEGAELAGLAVHVGAHRLLDVVLFLGRRGHRVLEGDDPPVEIDVLLVGDLPEDLVDVHFGSVWLNHCQSPRSQSSTSSLAL